MDPVQNPYQPGAGLRPAALVGRDGQLASWEIALARIDNGRNAQPVVLYGLRGVGKTVLLNSYAKVARERGWIVAKLEAATGKPLRVSLAEALRGPLADRASSPTRTQRLLRAIKTVVSLRASVDQSGTWTFGLDLDASPGGGADSGALDFDLSRSVRDLSDLAVEEGSGIAILIDEAQDLAIEELVALCSLAHEAGQEDWRVIVALAGLPSLPRVLAEAKSYSERLFEFHNVSALPASDAALALTEPAENGDVHWDDDAVLHVLAAASGFPYFLQQFGKESWDTALGPDRITLVDARVGSAVGQAVLDAGFFRARWDRATRAEQRYLRAMADDGDDGSTAAAVAERLDRQVSSLGPARASLISKGLVYAPEHGRVAFTVPGMAGFIARQPSDE
jgi:AAA ATPase domain